MVNGASKLFKLNLLLVVFLIALAAFLSLKVLRSNSNQPARNDGIELVDGFPQTPLYPGAVLTDSSSDTTGGFMFEASWESSDSIPKLSNWYLENLSANGWDIITPPADLDTPNIQLIVSEKDGLIYNFSFIKNTDSGVSNIVTQITEPANNDEEFEE